MEVCCGLGDPAGVRRRCAGARVLAPGAVGWSSGSSEATGARPYFGCLVRLHPPALGEPEAKAAGTR